jgi:hypothetical protein
MKSDEILTPLSQLGETALNLVMSCVPDLNIETSVKLAKAIVRELMTAQKDAAKRAIEVTAGVLTTKRDGEKVI